jgi:hypothetical protein
MTQDSPEKQELVDVVTIFKMLDQLTAVIDDKMGAGEAASYCASFALEKLGPRAFLVAFLRSITYGKEGLWTDEADELAETYADKIMRLIKELDDAYPDAGTRGKR